MFENARTFERVFVSGPQRSGTRIVAKAIAYDTGYDYVDEKEVTFHDFKLLEHYLGKNKVVIQCPGLCHKLHWVTDKNTIVVMVIRPIDEIEASEKRIGWSQVDRLAELSKYGYTEGIISKIKYDYWKTVQKPILGDRATEIVYHGLTEHPLFIKDRKGFEWNQTQKTPIKE